MNQMFHMLMPRQYIIMVLITNMLMITMWHILQNAYRINVKEQPDVVKQQIMEHGAVGASYTHYYAGENHLNNSYYDMQGIVSSGGGHAVMIVGLGR